MRKWLFFLPMLLAASMVRAQNVSAPITLCGQGPYYRLVLPLSIYGFADADLHDVRVVNAGGHAVPRAWLREEAQTARTDAQEVPIFALPVRDENAAHDTAVAFTIRSDGSLALRAEAEVGAKVGGARQWIIDVSRVHGSLLQARFTLSPETRGVFVFRLEASDDLQRWRTIAGQEQLVRLEQNGQRIERFAIDLERTRASFLRLTWADERTAPSFVVSIDSIDSEPAEPLQWLDAVAPERCVTDYCDYLLPGVPLQSLRIDLPEINTLAEVGVYGLRKLVQAPSEPVPLNPLYSLRHRRSFPRLDNPGEIPLIDTVVYWLERDGHEARSPTLALDGQVYARLRLRTRGPISALGVIPPTIAIAGTPRALVFLAQGQGPFVLRWGEDDGSRPMTLAMLIPGYTPDKPLSVGEASVLLPNRALVVAKSATVDDALPGRARKGWLWVALSVGVLLLAGMAWSLFSSLDKAQDSAEVDK